MKQGISYFKERMEREGRLDEFELKKREMTEEFPDHHHLKIEQLAAKALGYIGRREEVRLSGELPPKAGMPWDEIMASLPAKVADTVETQWIAAHPAMSRKSRGKLKDGSVVVTTVDIADAPSRVAVNALLGWVDRPEKFHEMLLQETRKRLDEGGEEEELRDVSLKEVERLLKEFRASE